MSIWVDDVDAIHSAASSRDLEVTWPPTDMPWNVREMHVRHPGWARLPDQPGDRARVDERLSTATLWRVPRD